MQLEGKVALVTGATSGIGRAIALAYVAEGARVVGVGRDEAALVELRAELGESGVAQRCDVTVEADVEHAVATAVERYGGFIGYGGAFELAANHVHEAHRTLRARIAWGQGDGEFRASFDAQVKFVFAAGGDSTDSFVLHQGGGSVLAKRKK